MPLTIDFDRQRITLTLGPPSPVEKGAAVIPLRQRWGAAFNVFYVPVPAAGGGSEEMLLDTGATLSAISPQMLRATTPLAQTIDENTTPIGDFVTDDYLVAGLTVGGCQQANMEVSLWSTNYPDKPALLGLNFLSRYLVTLDFSHNRLILLPRTGSPAIHTPFGMTLVRQDGKYRVTDVADDFPADRLGVRIDDELAAINGQPVGSLVPDDVLRSLTRLPEDRITLSFRHKAGALEATFNVADRAAFPHPAITGLILLHTSAASLSVDDVVPGSSCALAGIRKGDVLLQVNSIPVQRFYTGTDASSPDIRTELEKADVTLAVWRPSAQASFTYTLSSRSPDAMGPMVPRQPAMPVPSNTPSPPGIPSLSSP
jgi:hypothetical protein